MKKTRIKMIELIYLGMSILGINKRIVYEFGLTILNQNMKKEQNYAIQILIAFLFTFKLKVFLKIFLVMLSNGLINNYDENDERPLPIAKNKRIPGLFKYELGGKIMEEVVVLRPKIWVYLMDDASDKKKGKGTKTCATKRELMLENYKDCLFNEKTTFKKQKRFKSYYHDVFTEEIDKVVLSSIDNKRIQTFDRATTFPQETTTVKVCENEMLSVLKAKETLEILSKGCESEFHVT